MIQVNELRIGNWIYSDDVKMPYQLSAHGLFVVSNSSDNRSPILLTPEILEKCGLVKGTVEISKNKGVEECYWLDECFVLIRPNQNTFFGQLFIDIEDRETIWSTVIFNLHQLQNIVFAITGTELPITL